MNKSTENFKGIIQNDLDDANDLAKFHINDNKFEVIFRLCCAQLPMFFRESADSHPPYLVNVMN